jgi:hemolysin III
MLRSMSRPKQALEFDQTVGEEIANSVSHGVGFLLALLAFPTLIESARLASIEAAAHGRVLSAGSAVLSATIFGTASIVLYLASTVYHAMPPGRVKAILRTIDHAAIFLMIAGTYTPFTLGILRGGWGWLVFGFVWGGAVLGILLRAMGRLRHPVISAAAYIVVGYAIVIVIGPLWGRMPPEGWAWIFAGGVFYTAGVVVFALDQVRFNHFVWHLMVMCGTACHYVAVINYAW